MKRIWLVGSWLLATAVVSWITFQTLAFADQGVSEPLGAVVLVSTTAATVESSEATAARDLDGTATVPIGQSSRADVVDTSVDDSAASTTSATSPTTVAVTPSTATGDGVTEGSSDPSATTTPTNPTTSAPTTTSTVSLDWTVTTVASAGGSVTVRYRPDTVEYQAAIPTPGFEVVVDETSPEVRVSFDGADVRYDIRVRWHDGRLDSEVQQKG